MEAQVDPAGAMAVYAIGVPLVILIIAIEAVFVSVRQLGYYKRSDTLCSLGLLAGNVAVNGAIKGSTFIFYLYLYQYRVFDLGTALPLWLIWLLSFAAIDFVFYWFHRMSHRVRFMWAIHMNHHCSEEMNFVVAFRQPWLAPILKVPFFAALPLVGFDPTITLAAGTAATLWGAVGHTRVVPQLWRPLEWIFNTPSHHRVHHGSNLEYIDKNYGNLFIVWDRMFGTFQPEEAPVIYGLRSNLTTSNPFRITTWDWINLWRRMREAGNLRDALGYFFRPPGWQPSARPDSASSRIA